MPRPAEARPRHKCPARPRHKCLARPRHKCLARPRHKCLARPRHKCLGRPRHKCLGRPRHKCGGPWKPAAQECANSELETQNSKLKSSEVQMYCARILIDDARFPPFGFSTPEISSSSIENMENASIPDSDRERSISPLRVRHTRDKF